MQLILPTMSAAAAQRRGAWHSLPRWPAWRWPAWSGSGYRARRAGAAKADVGVQMPFGRAPLSFADIVERVKPAVVSIQVTNGGPKVAQGPATPKGGQPEAASAAEGLPAGSARRPSLQRVLQEPAEGLGQVGGQPNMRPSQAQGSGFVISADGYVVTNNHVIDNASKIQVSFDQDNKYEAELVGTDPRTDLALLKIKSSADLPVRQVRRQAAARRRLGRGRRQSVRSRRHGHGRHRLGAGPRHRLGPLRLHADRRGREPRQLRRPDLQPRRRGGGRQHRHLQPVGRQRRHRLRDSRRDGHRRRRRSSSRPAPSTAAGSASRSRTSTRTRLRASA